MRPAVLVGFKVSVNFEISYSLGRRREDKTKEDTKLYGHKGSGPPAKAKPSANVAYQLGDSQA